MGEDEFKKELTSMVLPCARYTTKREPKRSKQTNLTGNAELPHLHAVQIEPDDVFALYVSTGNLSEARALPETTDSGRMIDRYLPSAET